MLYYARRFIVTYPNVAICCAGAGVMFVPVAIAVMMMHVYGEYDQGSFIAPGFVPPMLHWAAIGFRPVSFALWLVGVSLILFGLLREFRHTRKTVRPVNPPTSTPDSTSQEN